VVSHKIHSKKAFTLIEVLVALLLLSAVVFVATGFIIPLQVTRQSATESSALNYGRSYIELVKVRWTQEGAYSTPTANLPVVATTGTPDLLLPTGWSLETNSSTWTAAENSRTLTVTVKPPQNGAVLGDWQRTWVSLSARITRP
jgi:prepilin-type N-terminal cleavage/methylation domain-containing protein